MCLKIAVCTCIKDETSYLKEWIDWHLDLGVDHIFLFEDDGSESHKPITNLYPNTVTLYPISIVKNEPKTIEGRQMQSVEYSIKHFVNYDWLAFIDADEFIELEKPYSLKSLLQEYKDYPGIYLSWKMYNANKRIDKPLGGVIESYPNPDLETDYSLFLGRPYLHKSIVNRKFNPEFYNIHSVVGGINMEGGFIGLPNIFKKAWIRHYFTKSWEEWVYRIMKRGDLCNGNRRLHLFFKANPDLKEFRPQLISKVVHMRPKNDTCLWLDVDFIYGGNVTKIKELNKSLISST